MVAILMLKYVAAIATAMFFTAPSTWGQEVNRHKLDLDLRYAVINEDKLAVREFLKQGADPNSTESNGTSALRSAVQKGNLSIVKVLVEAGADVNGIHPRQRRSLLSDAAGVQLSPRSSANIVRYLLEKGATPDAQALAAAASAGNSDLVHLFLDKGIPPDEGLIAAAAAGHAEVVEMLLNAGADVDGNPDNSPLAAAATHGSESVVAKLLSVGANPNSVDGRGSTPLHHAVGGASPLPVIKQLVNAGGRVDFANQEGLTPMREASTRGMVEVYDWLLAKSGGKEPAPSNILDDETLETAVLISQLQSRDERVRKSAQRLLVGRGETIIPTLLRMIEGRDLDNPIAELLVAMGPRADAAIPYLDSQLDDEELMAGVLGTLNAMGPRNVQQLPTASKVRAAESLVKGIHKNKRDVYGPFMMDLLVGVGMDATPQLLQFLNGDDPGLRAGAAESLKHASFSDEKLQAKLLQLLQDDPLIGVRRRAASGLANPHFHSEEAKRALTEVLAMPLASLDPEAIRNAPERERNKIIYDRNELEELFDEVAVTLATYGPGIIPELRDELASADENTRSNYAKVYQYFGGTPEEVAALATLLDDPSDAVRQSAHDQMSRVANLHSVEAGDLLLERSLSTNARTKKEAAQALARISMSANALRFVPHQLTIMADSELDYDTRRRALASALSTDKETVKQSELVAGFLPVLIEHIQNGEFPAQVEAITLLGRLGSSATSAKGALETLANKPLPERPATLPKVIRPGIDEQPGSDSHKYAVEQGTARMLRQEAAAAIRRINSDTME